MTQITHACVKPIRDKAAGSWRPTYHPCGRKASVVRDCKWYCKQHDPEAVAARYEARNAKWADEWQRDRLAKALAAAEGDRLGVAIAWPAGLPAGYVAIHYEQLRLLIRRPEGA